MPNRLTGEMFVPLLEKHPDFELMAGCWSGVGTQCGGCALTLAYYDRHGDVPAGDLNMTRVRRWARQEYGAHYVAGFTAAFDGDIDLGGDETQGYEDGRACYVVATEALRLC